MANQAQLARLMLLFTALMSAAPQRAHAETTGSHDRARARVLDRIQSLVAPLVSPVLAAQDEDQLEAAIEEQLLSGVLADVVHGSLRVLTREPAPKRELQVRFAASLEQLGLDRAKTNLALELSLLSTRLGAELLRTVPNDVTDSLEDGGGILGFDIEELLYSDEFPIELREAMHADLQAAICMLAIAYASTEVDATVPKWLLEQLLDRWIEGHRKSLPTSWALLVEHIELSGELNDALVELVRRGLITPTDLDDLRRRSEAYDQASLALAEHAERQPDGTWPPTSEHDD